MVFTIINYVCIVFFGVVMCAPAINEDGDYGEVYCQELPIMALEETLGAAYNPRYMSIDKPAKTSRKNNRKRTTSEFLDFYVDQNFTETIENEPAWTIKNHVGLMMEGFNHKRYKRSSINYKQEWQCESEVKWIDLGLDYFPRYLRTVECLTEKCWFGMYRCKPRSFTVKILKRKKNRCVAAAPGTKVGVWGLPNSLKEMWVWEERAVNFCCDCSM